MRSRSAMMRRGRFAGGVVGGLLAGCLVVCGRASADVNFLSATWDARGVGGIASPGFSGLTADYDQTGTATTSRTLMDLSFPPPGAAFVNQTMASAIEEDGFFQAGTLRIFTRGFGVVNGPGTAADAESVITATALIEVVGEAEQLDYELTTSGGSVVTPLLTGTNHRSSRLRISPQGGSPLVDVFRESSFTGGSFLFFQRITLDPGVYQLDLEIAFQIHGMDDVGAARSDAGAEITWPGIPAPGAIAVALPGGLMLARRRR